MKNLWDALDGRKTLVAVVMAIVGLYARERLKIEVPDEYWTAVAILGAAGLNGKVQKATAALASPVVVSSPTPEQETA